MVFFIGGLENVLRKWITEGCHETPETMAEMIHQEYHPL